MVWELFGFLLHAKYVRNPDFGMFFFPIPFSYYLNSLSPFFGNNTTDVETIPIPYSLKHSYKIFQYLCRTQYQHFRSLFQRRTKIYTVQKSRQCLVRQIVYNIPMDKKIGIYLKIAPSGLQQKCF